MKTNENSRRDFLATTLLAGAALAGCNVNPFTPDEVTDVKPSGKMVKLLSVDGEIIEVDEAFLKPVPELPAVTNSEARVGIPGKKFAMVIDLSRCKSVKKCQTA
jgi:molybdopterin-containing oxidoreductase family iron-sulfur binding subunit